MEGRKEKVIRRGVERKNNILDCVRNRKFHGRKPWKGYRKTCTKSTTQNTWHNIRQLTLKFMDL